ncbi:MAG TPA: Dyp-type peroxidase [Mycobacteriales bacterium]|jgi:deferrochelatase/peroxidase EfeB|nr:Dyp-type peroxidase [Mycobacteriales bacterium]
MSNDGGRAPLSRRAFLGTAALGTAVVGGATIGGIKLASDARAGNGDDGPEPIPPRGFRGYHQIGVLEHPAAHGLLAAFTCVDETRGALAETFRNLSEEIDSLIAGRVPAESDRDLPPPDSGVLMEVTDPGLTITVSVGASLFDARYGLADRKPRELVTMPFLANDRLDPARSHGDVLISLQGKEPDVCIHALRQIMRRTRSGLVLHWLQDTFTRPDAVPKLGQTQSRNLLGFKDGTANPNADDEDLMNTLVWTSTADVAQDATGREPTWTVGGTYQVVRVIRMLVERWDRAALEEQESIFGRRKVNGAPLSGKAETDIPDYADDPNGKVTPMSAHIRLANPRDDRTKDKVLVRRGMSYTRGMDSAGLLDQGLAFVSYQRRLTHFLETNDRLKGEPLEEYIRPEGGGFFYVLPGVVEIGDWLGRQLLT